MKRNTTSDGQRTALSHHKHLSRIRRLCVCAVLLIGQCIPSAALLAQQARVSLNLRDVPMTRVFQEIKAQTKMSVVYNVGDVESIRRVSVEAANESVVAVLDRLLRNTDLTYRVENNYLIFAKKGSNPVERERASSPELITVNGTVVDKAGVPLIGVSVYIDGTTISTVTDVDGNFTLTTGEGTILSVSYIGYRNKSLRITNTSLLQIVLEEDTIVLGDVVVTALGIKKEEKALAYNIQQLQASDILKVNDANFINNLVGKVAGITINSSSAGIGGGSKVVMRGTKSIAGNNNALYVIDGIPMPSLEAGQPEDLFTGMGQSGDGLANINPDDIESMSILSGPAAAALYGSDAANGVVLITTKQGQADHVSIQVSNSTLFMSPFVMPEFQNTYGSDAGSYYSWGEKLATPSSYDPVDFFRTGYNVFNSISLSTGTDKNQTYVSASAMTAEGIIPNNTVDRYNVGIRNTSRLLNDKLHLDVSATYISVKEQNMLAQGQYFNPLIPIYLFPRADHIDKYKTFERYNVERNFKTQYWPYGNMGVGMQNPYWIINRDNFENDKNRYMMSGGLKYDIADWINITGRVKMDVNRSDHQRKYYASTDGIFAGKYGAYYQGYQNTKQVYADLMININKYIGDFSLSAILGTSTSDVKYDYSYFGGDLMSVANLFSLRNLNTSQFEVSDDILNYHDQLQGVFGTAQVGYKSLVYLDLTARNDWSNALVNTKTKSIFYPSVGLSAIVTDIFGIKSNVLSFLKARISYSEVGNAPPRYITTPTYELVNGYPRTITFLFNDDLQPERTKSWEAGLNVLLWDKKLKLDATLYKSSTENQLFNPTLSSSSGFSSFYVNAGKIENKGIELSLELNQPIGPVQWKSNLIYSLNRNKIIQLLPSYTAPNGEVVSLTELNMGGTASYRMMLLEGGSMGDFHVNTLKTDEHGYIIVDQSAQTVSSDPNNFVYGGNVNPLYNVGFRNSFEWNGLSVGFMINARVGGEVVSVTQALMDAYGVSTATAKARDNGGATVNGQRIPAKEYYQIIGGGTSGVGSMYVYSATNVRLGELSIGYEVPVTKLVPAIKGLNVSFIGRNLFMFYNKAPFDPELTASTGTYYQGVDYFMPPSLRNLGFAVNIRF